MLELYRPSLRASGAIAVLFAWLASLGWLAMRRIQQTEESLITSEASLRLAPGTVWYALYAGSTQIGNAGITLDTLTGGYLVSQTVVLETRNGAGLARSTRLSKAWLGTAVNVERVESRFSREGQQTDWSVTLTGDTVTARFSGGGRQTHGRAIFAEAPTSELAIPYRLALGGGLAPGRTRTVAVMDGWPFGAAQARITVGRDSLIRFADSSRVDGQHWVAAHTDSVRAYAVVLNTSAGPRRLWIDHRGAVSGMDTPLGVRWVRTDFDLSATQFRRTLAERTSEMLGAIPEIFQFAASSATRDTATGERRYLLAHRDGSPVDPTLLALLSGGRQVVSGDTLIVHGAGDIISGESVRDAAPDPMIQSDAGAITTVQRSMLPEPPDRESLPAFMSAFRNMARVDTAVTAADDALGTLGAHAGRADGIARLFVALLRASGVASRYVVGVYPQGDTLLTHAWVEVWSPQSAGWYAVDPASGHVAANTGLIRLATGGSSHPDALLTFLANARLTEIGRKGKR